MRVYHFPEGPSAGTYAMLVSDLLDSPTIHTGEWQAMNTSTSSAHSTHELEDVSLVWDRLPQDLPSMIPFIDREWADEHHAERVGGVALNPAPSHLRWPYAVRGNADHTDTGKRFDHTYPERFWPQFPERTGRITASGWNDPVTGIPVISSPMPDGMRGIRFRYGDLSDVVDLLIRSPLTRQAFLPVWFPEDTGAHHAQRVPCSLGYHFMQRGGRLSVRYYLRSCDIYRHLSNDVYFTASLTQWVCDQVFMQTQYTPQPMHFRTGSMAMHISSLHAFVGDTPKINQRMKELNR